MDDDPRRALVEVLASLAEDLSDVHPRIRAARRENALEDLSRAVLQAWLRELDEDALDRLRVLLAGDPAVEEVRSFVERELDDHVQIARDALFRRPPQS